MDNIDYRKLAQALLSEKTLETKNITGTPTAQMIYAPGGIFARLGLEDTVVNASTTPRGIASILPAFAQVYRNPIYPFITGFDPDGSAEPVGVCEDCPGGIIEVCHQTAQFGRICRESQEMEINELIRKINRGETTDLRVLGDVLGPSPMMPQDTNVRDWLNLVTKSQMVIVGTQLQAAFYPMIWQGNPVNNTAGGGYQEFPGFDILISQPKVDLFTNVRCQAIEPDIKDFGYDNVCGTAAGDRDIVQYISYLDMYLRHVADRTGLAPVDWVIAMRPELWLELTACWPCRYLTNRCMTNVLPGQVNPTLVINDEGNVRMRDEMRNGMFLWVNGRQIPVITDDGIFEANTINNANLQQGEFASDIYFIPLRARGMRVTYFEYMDYRLTAPELEVLKNKHRYWVTDGGLYMWTMEDQSYCFLFRAKIEPRLILRTPHLSGRIENVAYEPLQHLRDWHPDSPYRLKGGVEEAPLIDANWFKGWETG